MSEAILPKTISNYMKIYTGGGDRGITRLFSGDRVFKNDVRVQAYGDIDELNAVLGAFRASFTEEFTDDDPRIELEIFSIQTELLIIGAWVATKPNTPQLGRLKRISEDSILSLEKSIDRIDAQLTPLKEFIIPGGNLPASLAHIARTVCRRAEREVTCLLEGYRTSWERDVHTCVMAFLNRLSDYLFVIARYCNHLSKIPDKTWKD